MTSLCPLAVAGGAFLHTLDEDCETAAPARCGAADPALEPAYIGGFGRQFSWPARAGRDEEGLQGAEVASARHASEPAKVHVRSCLKTPAPAPERRLDPEMEDVDTDGCSSAPSDDSSESHPASCGGWSLQGQSPRMTEAPTKATEPMWLGSPGAAKAQSFAVGPASAMLHGMPPGYTEQQLVGELRDAGFAQGRDIQRMQLSQRGSMVQCLMSFSGPNIARAFHASFDERPLRDAPGAFVVTPMWETEQTLLVATAPGRP